VSVQKLNRPLLIDRVQLNTIVFMGRSIQPPPAGMGAIVYDGKNYLAWDGSRFRPLAFADGSPARISETAAAAQ
jgi:hypothetical protein